MSLTLRRSFSLHTHEAYRHAPFSSNPEAVLTLLRELKPYLEMLRKEIMQPREAAVQALLQRAKAL